MEPVRILQVVTMMNRGGLETMLMNYYRQMDRAAIQFDFMVHRQERGHYDDEIESLGGVIHRMPPIRPGNYRLYFRRLEEFFNMHSEYRVVHSHMNENSGFVLRAAKRAGIPCRIAHSHLSDLRLDLKFPFRVYAKAVMKDNPNRYFACSKNAGRWLFGKRVEERDRLVVMNNAINLREFAFDPALREAVRAELRAEEHRLVIGHVGRFTEQKNHSFLLDILHRACRSYPDVLLVLIGEGHLEQAVRRKAAKLGLNDHIAFLGVRSDIPRLMQGMDLFLFPSLFEGLPVVLVEAQAAGLPCIASSAITRESDLTGRVRFIDLRESAAHWARAVLNTSCKRADTASLLREQGYDSAKTAEWLASFYQREWRQGAEEDSKSEVGKAVPSVPSLTVFTPTYNRANTLHLCYQSLLRQSCKDFVWLIIDDGSTDRTRELVESWIGEGRIAIRYHYQDNQGMHGAHNAAYERIDTELNVCIDSDDYLADGAVGSILSFWRRHGGKQYAGIVGLDATPDGEIIGTEMPEGLKASTLSGLYAKWKVKGDKKLVYRTEMTSGVPPYPVFPGERYVPLAYKYLLIDQQLPLLVMNEALCHVEYRTDGSSLNMINQYRRNPRGFAFFRKVAMTHAPSFKERFREAVHYVSSSLIMGNRKFVAESPCKAATLLALPLGGLLYLYIRRTRRSGPILVRETQGKREGKLEAARESDTP